MARIDELFPTAPTHGCTREHARLALIKIDNGLVDAARLITLLREFVLYPDDMNVETEEVASTTTAILAVLRPLGQEVDALRSYMRSLREDRHRVELVDTDRPDGPEGRKHFRAPSPLAGEFDGYGEPIHGPFAQPTSRRGQIARAARSRLDEAVARARRNYVNKLRIAYRVPYHDWEAALRAGPVEVDRLLEAYGRKHWG